MKFFRQPPASSYRRKFVWWPRRVTVVEGMWVSSGMPDEPYDPVKHSHNNAMQSLGGMRPPASRKSLRLGMFTPVWYHHHMRSEWIWLEWQVQQLNVQDTGYGPSPKWLDVVLPRQKFLWDEYNG